MITLQMVLVLSGLLFAIAVAGIFINRKNLILLLMCVELLLLAANMNFVAFSRHLGNIDGQVFVFFVLTVAAAEAAIGLAILVVLFRQRQSINVAATAPERSDMTLNPNLLLGLRCCRDRAGAGRGAVSSGRRPRRASPCRRGFVVLVALVLKQSLGWR